MTNIAKNSPHKIRLVSTNFPIAIGTIGSGSRITSQEFTAQQLQDFFARLADYFCDIELVGKSIPAQCVDGRSRTDGSYTPAPKAAGGTFTAVIGDALTNASYRNLGGNAAEHAKTIYAYFQRHDYVGGHDADHASDQGCGCGAEDKLEQILTFIHEHGSDIRSFLQSAHVTVEDELHDLITRRAGELVAGQYPASGRELRDAYLAVAGSESVETLSGPHHEVALVINSVPNSTIDRSKMAQTYGDIFQVFELDVPALQVAADALSLSPDEAHQKFIAMLYYNVATAAVLADQSLAIFSR